jgi:hypothetical protein
MPAKKEEKSIGWQRRVALKIPQYKMYKDYGNHACIHVAFTQHEAELWAKKLHEAYSVHIEKLKRDKVPGGYAYAVYIHG